MKTKLLCIALVTGALAFVASARSQSTPASGQPGRVQVIFEHPERYTDVQLRAGGEPEAHVLENLRDYIEHTAGPRIPDGCVLTVTFTNVDLAGEFIPTKANRQMKSFYPPKAKFSWILTDANGVVLRQDMESLVDAHYLTRSNLKRDPLFYEKEMLEVWIRRTFR